MMFRNNLNPPSLLPPPTRKALGFPRSELFNWCVCVLKAIVSSSWGTYSHKVCMWRVCAFKNSGDCTTVATQPRQLHYSNNLSKKTTTLNDVLLLRVASVLSLFFCFLFCLFSVYQKPISRSFNLCMKYSLFFFTFFKTYQKKREHF